ncbi:unnamed protein product [Amoebophrya sp. A25]|nr:unnamed protein product [Amoebophrya sp. A25]|eukprot:GSA25T00012048001.1
MRSTIAQDKPKNIDALKRDEETVSAKDLRRLRVIEQCYYDLGPQISMLNRENQKLIRREQLRLEESRRGDCVTFGTTDRIADGVDGPFLSSKGMSTVKRTREIEAHASNGLRILLNRLNTSLTGGLLWVRHLNGVSSRVASLPIVRNEPVLTKTASQQSQAEDHYLSFREEGDFRYVFLRTGDPLLEVYSLPDKEPSGGTRLLATFDQLVFQCQGQTFVGYQEGSPVVELDCFAGGTEEPDRVFSKWLLLLDAVGALARRKN